MTETRTEDSFEAEVMIREASANIADNQALCKFFVDFWKEHSPDILQDTDTGDTPTIIAYIGLFLSGKLKITGNERLISPVHGHDLAGALTKFVFDLNGMEEEEPEKFKKFKREFLELYKQ